MNTLKANGRINDIDVGVFGSTLFLPDVNVPFLIETDKERFYYACPCKLHSCINCAFENNMKFCKAVDCEIKSRNGIKYKSRILKGY